MQVPAPSAAPERPGPTGVGLTPTVPEGLVPGYRIRRLIGRGAMASVYLAEQISLGREVALKVLNVTPAGRRGCGPGLPLAEGRLLAAVSHRHIVTLYDIGDPGDVQYLSMEYLPGGDLRRRLATRVPVETALTWAEQIASALAAVHARGIVHRDLKPANVLFRNAETPVLTDFGVAKDLNAESSLTLDGTVVGTLAYLSPEQAEGHALDGRSDIYSLGVMLHEMLTGQRPGRGEGGDRRGLAEVLRQKRDPLPRLPRALAFLQGIVDRMSAVSCEERLDAVACALALARIREAVGRSRARRAATSAVVAPPPAASPAAPLPRNELARARLEAADRLAETCSQEYVCTTRGTPVSRRSAALIAAIESDRARGQLRLPALPDVVPRLARLMARPDVRVADIARLLQAEPVIASQLVRLANSAAYAGGQPVSGLAAALARIGFAATRAYVTALAARAAFRPGTPLLAERMRAVWESACRVAAYTGAIARQLAGFDPDHAQFAGLLQGVGRLAVLASAGRHTHLLDDAGSLRHVEWRLQAPLGAAVVAYWELPEELVTVALEAEQWQRVHEARADLCDLVQVARCFALAGHAEGEAQPDPLGLPAFGRLVQTVRKGTRLNLAALAEAETELDDLARCLANR
jgi:HD-like signal output (HDOD) protein